MLSCPNLSSIPGTRHGFFTRSGGVSHGIYASLNCGYGSGDQHALVAQNRDIVAKALGVETLCTAYQVHSILAVTVDKPWEWPQAPQADALVTATPGIAVGVLTADCVPVLFADEKQRVVGAAHAGWKGAFGGILEATIAAMTVLGADSQHIHASIGPAIAQGSYEVGSEFRERFLAQDEGHQIYFIHGVRPEHFLFDLPSYVKDRLRNSGISHINLLAQDTCSLENDFFSYRRATLRGEPAYGRQVSAIMLQPD